jgi:hypothetical protein
LNFWAKYRGLASLALLLLVAPVLVWQYALSGTVGQWRAAKKDRVQIDRLRAAQTATAKQPAVSTSDREMILSGEIVSALLPTIEAEKLSIERFSPCVTSDTGGLRLTTGQLTVQGRFAGIVRLLDELERELPHCKIVSVSYRKKKALSCTIYVQQITTTNE